MPTSDKCICSRVWQALLEAGDAVYHDLYRCAEEGRLRVNDRVLHYTGTPVGEEGGDGYRPGTVVSLEPDGKLRIRYDAMHLGAPELNPETRKKVVPTRKLPAREVLVGQADDLSQAPPETQIKKGDRVRVVQDANHIEGKQKWQYGRVYYCHNNLLLDIEYESGEWSYGLPAYAHEVQKAA